MNESKAGKYVKDSEVIMTEVVFPNDTNPLGILRGGRMMDWMDIASAVCAQTHANQIAVTASVDRVVFRHPVKLGDILTLKATITRSFKSSMEIYVEVWARRIPGGVAFQSNHAYFTFVALNEKAQPTPVPPVIPSTPEEKIRFEAALIRYEEKKDRQQPVDS